MSAHIELVIDRLVLPTAWAVEPGLVANLTTALEARLACLVEAGLWSDGGRDCVPLNLPLEADAERGEALARLLAEIVAEVGRGR